MAAILPSGSPSPVSGPFERKLYIFDNPYAVNPSATSLGTVLVSGSRQVSPASAVSARLLTNDENRSPNVSDTNLATVAYAKTATYLDGDHRSISVSTPGDKTQPREQDAVRQALADLQRTRRDAHTSNAADVLTPSASSVVQGLHSSSEERPPGHGLFSTWADSLGRRKRIADLSSRLIVRHDWQTSSSEPDALPPISGFSVEAQSRRQRLSNASSGFVQTVKTASFSNVSMSLVPRSLRLARSSDTQAGYSSHARFSVDSDRPTTRSSVEEAAVHRGMKRRQIIQELVTSEESYVADLKALVYLYSTLLATTSSLSSQTRASIQRNVIDLLHLHEQLIGQLRRVHLNAVQRQWADTASIHRYGVHRHIRWRSHGLSVPVTFNSTPRRTRLSTDAAGKKDGRSTIRPAEPVEAAEIAQVFRSLMRHFFVYEEYSAKYEVMSHELQKRLPSWSDYDMGIESLAKSISALDHRDADNRKGLTVRDLLIKPVQRVCRYPLLLADLHKHTPVADCPMSHAELETALQGFREVVREINTATDNARTREQIQRRWLLQERLNFTDTTLHASQFRALGHARLCGVLHITYQSRMRVHGGYALCILFDSHFVWAMPAESLEKFNIMAVLHLADLKVESASDTKGLQCHTALFTWKICFEADGQLYELLLSACSAIEEHAWKQALQPATVVTPGIPPLTPQVCTTLSLDLKPAGIAFGQSGTLGRRLSIQRAATVGNRASICQVIIRGTHNPQDIQDLRHPYASAINRSQSHLTTHRVVVLAPKRSERARLESALAYVWTRDTLPYPGMTTSRGGQIIRASAGSLVRKLSLASMHSTFARRSTSLTLASRKSIETLAEQKKDPPPPAFEVRRDSHESEMQESGDLNNGAEHELDVAAPPARVSTSKRHSLGGPDGLLRRGTKKGRRGSQLAPNDAVGQFYPATVDDEVEQKLKSRKRWSNPIGILKNLSADGIRHMLYSSK